MEWSTEVFGFSGCCFVPDQRIPTCRGSRDLLSRVFCLTLGVCGAGLWYK